MPNYEVEYDNCSGEKAKNVVSADDEAAALGLVLDLHDDVPKKRFSPRFTVQRVQRALKQVERAAKPSALGSVHDVDDKLVEMWEATELLVNAQQLQLQQLDNEEE
jgi:hypothetical protein